MKTGDTTRTQYYIVLLIGPSVSVCLRENIRGTQLHLILFTKHQHHMLVLECRDITYHLSYHISDHLSHISINNK